MFKLISIRISPFCELARWVLEQQGIPYRERCHAPMLSLLFTWMADGSMNVPVVLAPDATLGVKDFLRYIDGRARATDKIFPLDAGERQEAERMVAWLSTGLAITVRQYAYANMLPNRKVTSNLMVIRAPWWEWAFVKGLYPLQEWVMRKALKITPESTENARLAILSQFEELSQRLGPGRKFLIGDRLTAADLVFAAGTAPVTVPPEYGAPFASISDMPAAMQATVRSVQATAAGQHALRIYREYRAPAATAPDTSPPGEPGIFKQGRDKFRRGLSGPTVLRFASHLLRMKPVLSIGKTTVISTHEAVVKALDADEKYTIAEINAARMDRISGSFILGMDRGPQYDRENAAIRGIVKPQDLDWVRQIVEETANGLIATATPAGRLDVSSGFARISAARVVAEYFGVPGPSEHVLMQWMRSLFWDAFLNRTDVPAVRAAADQSAAELRSYLTALIAEKASAGAPADDILSRLIRAGTLDADGIRRSITGIVVGAIDTTATAVANAIAVLLDKPEAMAETRKAAGTGDEVAIRRCVYEALRFNPQTSALLRHKKADGNTALLLTISAMFDPSAFPQPGRFNAMRPQQKYLHFSQGMHTCYGLMINGVQLPALVGAIVQLPNIRRASGRLRPTLYEGPFPDRLVIEFGGQA